MGEARSVELNQSAPPQLAESEDAIYWCGRKWVPVAVYEAAQRRIEELETLTDYADEYAEGFGP